MVATFGPTSATVGMPGPPAMDIGMYSVGTGRRSASAVVVVFETMPTMVSQVTLGASPGRAGALLEATCWPMGSCLGKTTSASA